MPTAQDTFGIAGAPMMTFGVDVGGSKVEVALVDDGGRIVRERALRAATERLQVVCAALGNYAPVVGAAALARPADASQPGRTRRERVDRARRQVSGPSPSPSPPDARP